VTTPDDPDTVPRPASDAYPALVRAVQAVERRHAHVSDPLERTVAYSHLLRALQEQVEAVTAERDQALIEVLTRALIRRTGSCCGGSCCHARVSTSSPRSPPGVGGRGAGERTATPCTPYAPWSVRPEHL
jgi:ferredoxin